VKQLFKSFVLTSCLLLGSPTIYAGDWIATYGLSSSISKFSLPSNPSSSQSTTLSATLFKSIDRDTFAGGNVAYGVGDTRLNTNDGKMNNDVTSFAAFAGRNIGNGRTIDGSIAYGQIALDGSYFSTSTVSYKTDAKFLALSGGITQGNRTRKS